MNAPIQINSFSVSGHIRSAVALDNTIEDARNKKKNVDSNMASIISLRREVECREKAAEEAKKEADECSLYLLAKMDELKQAEQRGKEINDKNAREVSAQKAALATEMQNLQLRVSDVLDDGDESLAVLDEIRKSLEERLISSEMKKEAAEKEKLEKEVAFAYQKSQMEKVIEESKRLEQEAMENYKLQEFLVDRGHVVNMLQEEISCKCLDVNLLKAELEDYQEAVLGPIIQETKWSEDCKPLLEEELEDYQGVVLGPIIQETKWSQDCKRLLEWELEDYQDTVFGPIIQETTWSQDCKRLREEELEDYQDANENLEPIIKETEWSEEDCRWDYKWMNYKPDTREKYLMKHSKKKVTRKLIGGLITEAVKEYQQDGFAASSGIPYWSYKCK